MATYYNITATIAFDQIDADSPQQAAAKAYAAILAQAEPERILVWEQGTTATGGVTYTSTAWTFDADPEQIIPKQPEPAKPIEQATEAPTPAEADAAEQTVNVEITTDDAATAAEAPLVALS